MTEEEQIHAMEHDLVKLETECNQLRLALQEAQQARANLQSVCNEYEKDIQQLQQRVKELEEVLPVLQTAWEHLIAERDQQQAVIQQLAEALRGLSNVDNLREGCHVTYNGGHHEEETRKAFHHGMDTVCNVLAERMDKAKAALKDAARWLWKEAK